MKWVLLEEAIQRRQTLSWHEWHSSWAFAMAVATDAALFLHAATPHVWAMHSSQRHILLQMHADVGVLGYCTSELAMRRHEQALQVRLITDNCQEDRARLVSSGCDAEVLVGAHCEAPLGVELEALAGC